MSCRTCIGLDCDDGPALGTYSLQRVILPEVTSTSGEISVAALGSSYGCLDSPYSANIVATGRLANSQTLWSVIGGSLPTGLTLVGHGNYATLSGTPTAGGIYRFTVLAEASNGDVSARAITFPVYRNWVVGACTAPASGTVQTLSTGGLSYRLAYCPTSDSFYVVERANSVKVLNAKTGVLVSTITVGTQAFSVCYSPTNDRVYVANAGSDTVSIINPSSNLVTDTISVGNSPINLAFGNDKVYVSHWGGGGNPAITVLSTASTPSIVTTILSGVGPGEIRSDFNKIIYASSANDFYGTVFSQSPYGVMALDADTNTEVAVYDALVSGVAYPTGVCVRTTLTPDRGIFLCVEDALSVDAPTLVAFTSSGVWSASLTTSPGYSMPDVAWKPTNDTIYAIEYDTVTGDSFIRVVNPSTMVVTESISLGSAIYAYSIDYIQEYDILVVTTDAGLKIIT